MSESPVSCRCTIRTTRPKISEYDTSIISIRYTIIYNWIYPVVNDSISDTNDRGIVFADFGSGSSNSASATYWAFTHSLVANLQANDNVKFKVRGTVTSATIKGTTESQWNIDLLG